MLDGSSFDALVPIRDFGGSLASVNPDLSDFINLIDGKAYDIFKGLMKKFHLANQIEAKRMACYTAAEGQNAAANLTYSPLLKEVHPINYFKDIIPSIVPRDDFVHYSKRKKYKLAYLMMVHEKKGFDQLVETLEILDDGHAITLIHVDAKASCGELFSMIDRWITARKEKDHNSAVYLAKTRFCNIWGHISLVNTQLSGFWELMDIADWDYVINLSNYDYPLKSNAEIYETLQLPHSNGMNFVEYWTDTSKHWKLIFGDLSERFFKTHLAQFDFSNLYHPPELGLIASPFPRWRAYKHHQWIILTPEAVKFFRTDSKAITFLAFAEHSFIPDESYIGTGTIIIPNLVLVNSPQFDGRIINDNRRYLRFNGGAHPTWLGYKDRHLFPPNEPSPSFFFIRKVNSLGNMFGEQKLVKWIKERHMFQGSKGKTTKCNVVQMSVRIECIQEIAGPIAFRNSLIVIPVSTPYLDFAMNLACSLKRLDITNVIYWALDLDVYETLLERAMLTILLPGLDPLEELQKSKSASLQKVLRSKPRLLEMILNAGFSVWMMDADMIALQDFRKVQDLNSDMFVSHANDDYLNGITEPVVSSSLVYYRNNERTIRFLEEMKRQLSLSSSIDDEVALQRVLHRSDLVKLLSEDHSKLFPRDDLISEDLAIGETPMRTRVRFLDPFRFATSLIFKGPASNLKLPSGFTDFYTLHWNGQIDKKDLVKRGIWFVDEELLCTIDQPEPKIEF
jgi:hypothetical protein